MPQRNAILAGVGFAALAYSFLVLGFIVTAPDLRVRALIADWRGDRESGYGVRIQTAPGLHAWHDMAVPQPGDILVRVAGQEIRSFLDLTLAMESLRGQAVVKGYENRTPDEARQTGEPVFAVKDPDGQLWARVEFLPEGDASRQRESWLAVQSLPARDLILAFTGFVLEFLIFVVGALACWNRPFDRSAHVFFAMCIVTLGAVVGGSHWWVIAARFWLIVPFAVCAMLVPVVSLHFFLVYPRPKSFVARFPRGSLAALYGLPTFAIAVILGFVAFTSRAHSEEDPTRNAATVLKTLDFLQRGISAYFLVAAGYFVALLASLADSYRKTRTATELSQLRWIGAAAVTASGFIAYSLYVALADRGAFARGAVKVPMFVANVSFMLAYAVAILRHKLLLVDQFLDKGALYWIASTCLTLAFSLAVGLSILLPQVLNITLLSHQVWLVAVVLTLTVMVFLWLRDRVQQAIDRRFFREKYRLDEALQRINRAVGRPGEPGTLATMMLGSCRDVLGVERAGLYLRSGDGPLQLVAAETADDLPARLDGDGEWLRALREVRSAQRITGIHRRDFTPLQRALHELHVELIHALESDGTVAGVVLLGEKKSRTPYTAEDLTFLDALAQMTHVALHGARVIDENLTRMNEELQGKVQKITEQRRQIELLQAELTRAQQPAAPPAADGDEFRRDGIRGSGAAIASVLDTARKVASSHSSVLIRGESGTGKELLAQVLHDNSPRRGGPMVRVHCASLSPGLLESELFGHVKGAFTGAHRDKVGRFEAANGGTLFLDEIGDISLETQIKLLRVLQERRFEPVGGTQTVSVDVRLITATHQDLERLIAAGTFREDLYYRLNVISITLPPLRERPDDVIELALHFLNRSAARTGKRITHFDEEALAALQRHRWPGNVRELENVIERAVVLAEDDRISLRDLPPEFARPAVPARILETKPAAARAASFEVVPARSGNVAAVPDEAAERDLLRTSLARCRGNKAEAARLLGMPRSTFFSKLKKHGLN